MNEIKLSKIEIEINDQKLSLTYNQVKELKEKLDNILGTEDDPVYIPVPYYPYIDPYSYPVITCDSERWNSSNTFIGSES